LPFPPPLFCSRTHLGCNDRSAPHLSLASFGGILPIPLNAISMSAHLFQTAFSASFLAKRFLPCESLPPPPVPLSLRTDLSFPCGADSGLTPFVATTRRFDDPWRDVFRLLSQVPLVFRRWSFCSLFACFLSSVRVESDFGCGFLRSCRRDLYALTLGDDGRPPPRWIFSFLTSLPRREDRGHPVGPSFLAPAAL